MQCVRFSVARVTVIKGEQAEHQISGGTVLRIIIKHVTHGQLHVECECAIKTGKSCHSLSGL